MLPVIQPKQPCGSEPQVWKQISTMSFITVRDTKIQTFQYKIIHNIISCNQRLYKIKIKETNECNFCNDIDNLPHFFLTCNKVKHFWYHWFNWWDQMSGIEIIRQNLVSEWILMMRSLNWISAKSLMSAQHEWEIWLRSNEGISLIKIHSLTGFCFYPMLFFFNMFLVELFIFI